MERGLRELAADTASGSLRKAISAVAAELESGKSIEEAFGTHSRGFPPLYSEVLRAGVSSGRLGQALNDLNRRLEFSRQTRRIVFEALAYPAVVLALATIVLTAVLAVVVPHFEPFLADFSGRLPLLTRMLFGVSHHLVQAWMFIGALAAAAVVSGILLGQSAAGQRFKEACLLKLPVSGGMRPCWRRIGPAPSRC